MNKKGLLRVLALVAMVIVSMPLCEAQPGGPGGFPGGTHTAVLPQPAISKENIYEYPRCPKCWAGNREGEPQSVFFVEAGNYFQCERGHQFLRNGKMRN